MKVNFNVSFKFQSTYLYKVRLTDTLTPKEIHVFQSTYLYKVRRTSARPVNVDIGFNPRTYIRYDPATIRYFVSYIWFQSTYLYKVRRR